VLLIGSVHFAGDRRLNSSFRLWNVAAGKLITGHMYLNDPGKWQQVAHVMAQAINGRIASQRRSLANGHN
jgi:Tol biopolymer transport system component